MRAEPTPGALLSVVQAIILGIVQGLTEFLPVSSSGHLILVPWLFHWTFFLEHPDLNKTFDVALHIGTFVGAATYFRADIARYLGAFFRSVRRRTVLAVDERLAWYLIVASIPGALAGAVGESFIEKHLGQPWLIAVMLALFGVVLLVVDHRAKQQRHIEQITIGDAVLMGIAQAVALSPGVSRAGVTITAGRARALTRDATVRFSFLMSLPIIGGAGLYKGLKLAKDGLPPGTAAPFVWGMIASAVTGFAAVWFVLRFIRRHSFDAFAVYRVLAALTVFGVILSGLRPARG
ncbi:MAG: undecaprenyl-diphosphate phosphatase [Actinobacteria bacterium]|nr:undecaprenyl-diphosphate phosphatase [Actinomycetota bacterium]